jgi:hypothetical protein
MTYSYYLLPILSLIALLLYVGKEYTKTLNYEGLRTQRRQLTANMTLLQGRQAIVAGCANFYGSNWAKHPQTDGICNYFTLFITE